jgi:hypothetical protein
MSVCKSCGTDIVWAVSERGRRMPVDAERRPDGNIVLSHRRVGEPPVALVQSAESIERLRQQAPAHEVALFVSHFATCPNAAKHRKRR